MAKPCRICICFAAGGAAVLPSNRSCSLLNSVLHWNTVVHSPAMPVGAERQVRTGERTDGQGSVATCKQ